MTVGQAVTWLPDSEKVKLWDENAEVIIKALDLHFVEHIPEKKPKREKRDNQRLQRHLSAFDLLKHNYELCKAMGRSEKRSYDAVASMWEKQLFLEKL